jgi:hypothetical protein
MATPNVGKLLAPEVPWDAARRRFIVEAVRADTLASIRVHQRTELSVSLSPGGTSQPYRAVSDLSSDCPAGRTGATGAHCWKDEPCPQGYSLRARAHQRQFSPLGVETGGADAFSTRSRSTAR